jgi:hypothetical protein
VKLDYIEFASQHYFERGDKIDSLGKRYVVVRVVHSHRVAVRRTFWQWLKDSWKELWS